LAILEKQAASLGELIECAIAIARAWTPNIIDPQELWYRGQSRASFPLLPGLYRPHIRKLNYDEFGLFERFKMLALPHCRSRPVDDWEWYFLSQHYGLPTRLLDWSESLFAAAYFAIAESILKGTRLDVDMRLLRGREASSFGPDSPVVWMMDAGTLNLVVTGDDNPYLPGGRKTTDYLPKEIQKQNKNNRRPLALLPVRANDRINAQQGMFTIHGHECMPLEALALSASRFRLARIVLDSANLSHLWEELQVAGTTKLGLFPSIETAAEHARWIMQSATSSAIVRAKKKKKSGPKKPPKKR
jgi:hypothetical protein